MSDWLKYEKGQLTIKPITIDKVKNGKPTVIIMDDKRYVLDMKGAKKK